MCRSVNITTMITRINGIAYKALCRMKRTIRFPLPQSRWNVAAFPYSHFSMTLSLSGKFL